MAQMAENFDTLGEVVYEGRPDLAGDFDWGKTYAKDFPTFVYSLGKNGCLIHRVRYVQLRWWTAHYDRMIRLRKPVIIAETVCGNSRFIQSGGRLRATFCETPRPDAVLCKRCMGEGASTFPRSDPASKQQREAAKLTLGCLVRGYK